jgi:putative spermidine/putrescine transport system substrate-binding protein
VNTLKAKAAGGVGVPKEGSTGWADTTMLHAKAKNPVCATSGWSTR